MRFVKNYVALRLAKGSSADQGVCPSLYFIAKGTQGFLSF